MRWILGAAVAAMLTLPAAAQGTGQGVGHACVLEPDAADRNAGAPVERFERLGCARGDVINAVFPNVGWRNAFAALLCDFDRQVLFSEGPVATATLPMLTCVHAGAPRQVRR